MQLQPGERAVLGYFADDSDARAAADELKQAGYNEYRIDRISPYSSSTMNQGSKAILSSLTMNNCGAGLAYGPLLAADPAASGMSADYDSPASFPIVLTLICEESTHPQAVEILRQYGASV